MSEKPAPTTVPLAELLARRWSARAIDAAQPVSRADCLALLEAARWAPSCFGDQPWRFVVWDRFRDQESWAQASIALAEGNRVWANAAPVLILVAAAGTFRQNGRDNRWAQYDSGAAAENLCLQATELGLVVHQMGGFDVEIIAQVAGLPAEVRPMAMIAVGHPASVEVLPEALRERELAPRTRLPLAELFFDGRYGLGFAAD